MRRRSGAEGAGGAEPPRKRCRPAPPPACSPDASLRDDEALPPGSLMTDMAKQKWRIGSPIGRGSFGRIYLASDDTESEVTRQNARYVVKIEPHTNGPLFVEIHALIRRARAAMVKEWRIKNKQKSLGMPIYIASGSFTDEATDTRYRFLVLPRYEVDLEKIISRRGGVLDLKNVLVLAVQILDVLEYLHGEGYTHSDIKSSNLMLGFDGMKFGKVPIVNPTFLKQVRKVTVLKQKQTQKQRTSNYYNDEDFVMRDYKSSNESPEESSPSKEKKLMSVRKRMRKMLSDRTSRNLHRHHAFNLRQLSSQINYEDFNSSICSDESYQRLLDEHEVKYSLAKGFHEKLSQPIAFNPPNADNEDTFSEAILSQSNGQIYLLDYGLASKFLDGKNGEHKEFGMDARKAHDGTLEYSSRDSHIGAHSRRSDLETLGFNILDWLTGTLPWKTTEMLAEPDLVHALKKNYMDDVKTLLKTCFKTEFYPEFLEKYLKYVTSLEFNERPDYNFCRSIFKAEFARSGYGGEKDMRLCLNEAPRSPMSRKMMNYSKRLGRNPMKNPADFITINGIKKVYGRENIQSLENDLKLELLKKALNSSNDGIRKPCASRNFFISDADLVARLKQSLLPLENLGKKLSPKNLRSKKRLIQKKRSKRNKRNSIGKFGNFLGSGRQFSWAEILAGKPEHIVKSLRKDKNAGNDEDDNTNNNKSRNRKISSASETSLAEHNTQSPLLQKDYLQGRNPTYAMKEIHMNFRKKMSKKSVKEPETSTVNMEGYTPAMLKVIQARDRREAKEKALALKEKQMTAKNSTVKPSEQNPRSSKPSEQNTRSSNRKPAAKTYVAKKSPMKTSIDKVCQSNNVQKTTKNVTKKPPTVSAPVKDTKRNTRSSKSVKVVFPTPVRRVLESKRKPIIRIEKVLNDPKEKGGTDKRTPVAPARAKPVKLPFPTPIRRILESERKPIVRIEKKTPFTPAKAKSSKSTVTIKSPPTVRPLRRTIRLLTNQRVTRSAGRMRQ